jgi:hypothetical protein
MNRHVSVALLPTPAGFELGSGISIKPMLAEEVTRLLRNEAASPTANERPS